MGGIPGVHHLNCAHVTRMHLGGKPLACHVMLLEASRDGLVLVDTGLGTEDYTQIIPGSAGPSRTGTPSR